MLPCPPPGFVDAELLPPGPLLLGPSPLAGLLWVLLSPPGVLLLFPPGPALLLLALGFAVATIVKPEILIVDEVLAVGDAAFQEKCKLRMEKMLSDGTTLLFVSHSIEQVKELCQNVIWIDKGIVKAVGKAEDVIPLYAE